MSLRLRGVVLVSRDPAALALFYERGLGFTATSPCSPDGPVLSLGAECMRIVPASAAGTDYPLPRASNDPWFQHIAVVVTDMRAAYRRALDHGAVAITIGGPQRLPESSGGVTAWKFRDPDGHPLELLEFPPAACPAPWRARSGGANGIGIDHSAIVVADTERSVRFYAALGFAPAGGSLNRGKEQAALDGLADPAVVVTALRPPGGAPPHLELLEYRAPAPVRPTGTLAGTWAADDVAATRLLAEGGTPALLRDPDGHFLAIATVP
ncbi:MAG: VOC family protein [Acetobacteraceae bacterium]